MFSFSKNCDVFIFHIFTGSIHCQESNSSKTRKEAVKPENIELNRISDLLLERSRERINNSCEALRASISEVSQNRATEYSLNLLKELVQDFYADLSNDNCELLLYVHELFHKEVLDFGNELVKSLLIHFDKSAQSFCYGLMGELVDWYDDGFVKDNCELNAEFDEQMKEFTKIAKQNLIPPYENKLKRYGILFGNAIEERLQSDEALKASKERKNDYNALLTELDETGNDIWGKETGVRLQETEDPQTSKKRNNDSNKVASELDEAENGLLGKEIDTVKDTQVSKEITTESEEAEIGLMGKESDTAEDIQASKEIITDSEDVITGLDEAETSLMGKEIDKAEDPQASKERTTDIDKVPKELHDEEKKQNDTIVVERETNMPAKTTETDKDKSKTGGKAKRKKFSLKRLWCGIKRVFCCVSVAEGNE